MDLKNLKKIVEMVENANISHLSIEDDGTKIEVKKELEPSPLTTISQTIPAVQPAAPVSAAAVSVEPDSNKSDNLEEDPNITVIKSDMVGTFYASPKPEDPPYIKVGDPIKSGDTICIIEAMKLFNEILSEVDGVVEKVLVKNSEPVEYGQALFLVRSA